MSSLTENERARNEAAQLFDKYQAIMDLAEAETDPAMVTRLRHEAKKTWHAWLAASEKLITRDAYLRKLGE